MSNFLDKSAFGKSSVIAIALLFLLSSTATFARSNSIEKILAKGDGASKATAYRVGAVDEEYAVLRARHLRPGQQDLIIGDDGHPYDLLTATAEDGSEVKVWFDIRSFYGRGF